MTKKEIDPNNPVHRLKGHKFTSETAKAAAKKSAEARKKRNYKVEALLEEAGVPEEERTATLRQLASNAISGSSADMRLFLQQTGQLTKAPQAEWDGEGACPTCGMDPLGGLVITAESVEAMADAVERLAELDLKGLTE